jgi:pimeloyl-ACP methyl ester carboxylesterase
MTPASARRLRLLALVGLFALAGCGGGVYVRPRHSSDLLDAWRASAALSDQPSPRTLQTLRRYDLDDLYARSPAQAAAVLYAQALREPNPDLLFALAEVHYHCGRSAERGDCSHAVGHYYLCAGFAYHFLFATARPDASAGDAATALAPADAFDPRFRLACDLYNAGLSKCIAAAQRAGRLDPRHPLTVPTPDGRGFTLTVNPVGFSWEADEFGPLLPCDEFEVVGLANYYRTYGLGVPLIGTRAADAPSPKLPYYPRDASFPVTAFFRFEGDLEQLTAKRSGQLELYNPLNVQSLQVRGRRVPLETDLSTPLAHFLARGDVPSGAGYLGFLRPDDLGGRQGVYMLEPYQPGKIPVVLVHGLLSSPLTWAPLFNDLRADPVLRERYQFWVFFYPTGNPFLVSAAGLRQSLEHLRVDLDPQGRDAALGRMVLVGHSMGGLVSRMTTVDSGDDFWNEFSDRTFASLKLSDADRGELQPVFFFQRESCVRRVIFVGTPHHGSQLSPSPIGRLAAHLVRLPTDLMQAAQDLAEENPGLAAHVDLNRLPNSVDLLAPGAGALELLAARPIPPGVLYHSIIGVAPPSRTRLERWLGAGAEPGDGIVPYRSAHLDGVDSERVVPADHFHVHQHPLSVLEVRRILLEHLHEADADPGIVPVSAPGLGAAVR